MGFFVSTRDIIALLKRIAPKTENSDFIIPIGLTLKDLSNPPIGNFRVTNIYVNKEGKCVVEYDNTPM